MGEKTQKLQEEINLDEIRRIYREKLGRSRGDQTLAYDQQIGFLPKWARIIKRKTQ